jgi:hypothetical protein
MRLTTETKHALKTTEFWAMVAVIAGILVASWINGTDPQGGRHHDSFPAIRAWLYVAIVAVGYMVSRGLAKAGSSDPYWSRGDDGVGDGDLPLGRDG